MILNTERLKLIPLTLENLQIAINSKSQVERALGLDISGKELNGMMKTIYQIKINRILQDQQNYLFYTYWQIVSKETNRIIGEVGYKGAPNEQGEIEVGYGIHEEFQGNGYMTEALFKLINWSFSQWNILFVIASTDKNNIASHRVLQKVGMEKYKEDDNYYWWRIKNM